MPDALVLDKVAFENLDKPDRGYAVRATYLKEPRGDALVEIFKDGDLLRKFLFPAYKVWNIAAHFRDIVDGELEKSGHGYGMAAWTGIGPVPEVELEPQEPDGAEVSDE